MTHELDDFLDVKEVKGWTPDSKAETVFAAVFLVGLLFIVGLALWLV
jgi:hypothetical protein